MAQPVNAFDSYDARGIREDLSDIIYNISPEETPLYSKCRKVKASNTYHEWQTDALRASADNAHPEGDDTTAEARNPTTRLGNYTQIFKNAVTIPGSDDFLNKAGRGDEMAYQVLKVAKEQKLDIEKALFANQARVSGSSVTARRMAGLGAWLKTNTSEGSGGSDPTGDGTNARTDGAPRALTQAFVDAVMQAAWRAGGKVDTCYLSDTQMNVALGFVGNNNQRNTVKADEVSKVMDVYITPWGKIMFVPTRENRNRDLFILQSDMWKIAVGRGTRNEPLAKTGDSEKRQVITELTLESCNEAASAAVFDLS